MSPFASKEGGKQESIRGSDVNSREEHSPRKMGISGKQRSEWPRVIVHSPSSSYSSSSLGGAGGEKRWKNDAPGPPVIDFNQRNCRAQGHSYEYRLHGEGLGADRPIPDLFPSRPSILIGKIPEMPGRCSTLRFVARSKAIGPTIVISLPDLGFLSKRNNMLMFLGGERRGLIVFNFSSSSPVNNSLIVIISLE